MAESVAEFELRLKDSVSNPARTMSANLGRLEAKLRKLEQSGVIDRRERNRLSNMGGRQIDSNVRRLEGRFVANTLNPPLTLRQRLEKRLGDRTAENLERKRLGMKQLPSLMEKSPSSMGKLLRAAGMGGLNTGILGNLIEAAPAMAAFAAGIYALKTAFDFVSFSVRTVTDGLVKFAEVAVGKTMHALSWVQRMQIGYTALLKHEAGTDGVEVFNKVRKEAPILGMDPEDATESYRKLLAAQFQSGDAATMLRSMADLQAAGSRPEDIKYALLAISQIKMKGKLQAEELTRQLANAGVSSELVYNEIQDALGLGRDKAGRDKVLALQQEGQISSDVALPAIVRAIGKKVGSETPGELAKQKTGNIGALMVTSLGGQLTNAFGDVAQMIEGPFMSAAKTVFGSITTLFDSPLFETLKTNFADIFIESARFVEKYWPSILPIIESVITTLSESFRTVADYIRGNGDTIVEKLVNFGATAFALGEVMWDVTMFTYQLGLAFLDLIAPIQKINAWIMKMAPSPNDKEAAFKDLKAQEEAKLGRKLTKDEEIPLLFAASDEAQRRRQEEYDNFQSSADKFKNKYGAFKNAAGGEVPVALPTNVALKLGDAINTGTADNPNWMYANTTGKDEQGNPLYNDEYMTAFEKARAGMEVKPLSPVSPLDQIVANSELFKRPNITINGGVNTTVENADLEDPEGLGGSVSNRVASEVRKLFEGN